MVRREHFFPDGKSLLQIFQRLIPVSQFTPSSTDIVVAGSQIRMVRRKHFFPDGKSLLFELQRLVIVS